MKRLLALALVAVLTTPLWAVKSADNARAAAIRWGGHRQQFGGRAGAGVERVTRHSPTDGDEFFAVKFASGGTAFVAGDGEDELPIAFTTSTNDYSSIDKASPLWALLERDAKARKLGAVSRPSMALGDSKITSDSAISDMRVPPLVQSKWNQGGGIYNYYTPNNYVCGCVATAMSQVMRYHEYPTESRAQITRKCWLNTVAAEHTSKGGTYEWADMPLVPSSPSETQKQAIGKLTYDAGVAVYMNWTSGSSGAFDFNVPNALAEGFGYQSAVFCSISKISTVLVSGIFANLEAGYPVIFGISASSGANGHCIVGDGYGYEGGLPYVHLNLGWGGGDDMWYNLPDIATSQCIFSVVNDMVGNIFPTNALGSVTISGRITDGSSPRPQARVRLSSATTGELVAELPVNECGVWGAVVTGGVYSVQAIEEGAVSAEPITVTISPQSVYRQNWGGYITSTYVENYTNIPQVTSFANRTGVDFVLVGENQVACPSADVAAGTIYGSTNVALSCATGGAVIRYTLDETMPEETADVYSRPITIDHACTLKARAFKDGLTASPVLTVVYSWHRDVAAVVTVRADGTGDYQTIRDAVADAVNGDVIIVGPGVYSGCVEVPTDIRVTIVSTDGPDCTSIFVPSDDPYCCVYFAESPDSIISGFTLTNGWDYYGGGIWGGTASNCVIRDCYAYNGGGGAAGAELFDCVIDGCSAYYGGGAYRSVITDCVVANCEADLQGGGASCSTLVNCTVRGNSANAYRIYKGTNYSLYAGGGLDCDCLCTNTVVWGNYGPGDGTDDWEWYRVPYGNSYSLQYYNYAPTFRWCCTSDRILWGESSITNDPLFVSAEAADPRVYAISPCIGAANDGVHNQGAYQGPGVVPPLSVFTPNAPIVDKANRTIRFTGSVDPVGYGSTTLKLLYGPTADLGRTNVCADVTYGASPVAYDTGAIDCNPANRALKMRQVFYCYELVETVGSYELQRFVTSIESTNVVAKGMIFIVK